MLKQIILLIGLVSFLTSCSSIVYTPLAFRHRPLHFKPFYAGTKANTEFIEKNSPIATLAMIDFLPSAVLDTVLILPVFGMYMVIASVEQEE